MLNTHSSTLQPRRGACQSRPVVSTKILEPSATNRWRAQPTCSGPTLESPVLDEADPRVASYDRPVMLGRIRVRSGSSEGSQRPRAREAELEGSRAMSSTKTTPGASPSNGATKAPLVPFAHFTVAERAARGNAVRTEVPRNSHAGWEPRAVRFDPVELLEEQAKTRVEELVADRVRADPGLAVHVLSRGGVHHGLQSCGHATDGAARAAVRRRAPLELRCLRGPGPASRLRHERL